MSCEPRNDVPPEVRRALQEQFPNVNIVSVDALPPEARQRADDVQQKLAELLAAGRCLECGTQIPGWPDDEEALQDWDLPCDWYTLTDAEDEPTAWLCPTCHAEESVWRQLWQAYGWWVLGCLAAVLGGLLGWLSL
jgi:hypothetical protein